MLARNLTARVLTRVAAISRFVTSRAAKWLRRRAKSGEACGRWEVSVCKHVRRRREQFYILRTYGIPVYTRVTFASREPSIRGHDDARSTPPALPIPRW